jgi:hypothetical protein
MINEKWLSGCLNGSIEVCLWNLWRVNIQGLILKWLLQLTLNLRISWQIEQVISRLCQTIFSEKVNDAWYAMRFSAHEVFILLGISITFNDPKNPERVDYMRLVLAHQSIPFYRQGRLWILQEVQVPHFCWKYYWSLRVLNAWLIRWWWPAVNYAVHFTVCRPYNFDRAIWISP